MINRRLAVQNHVVVHRLSRKIGLRDLTASHGPRLHDFRHRFVARALVNWYRSGQEVERRLPVLSTYLGHVHASDTYWYLTISARSRNLRLTAIRSFFHYAAYEEPAHAAQIQRILAIPGKRCVKPLMGFLDRPEIDALLAAPDQRTWYGRRDHVLLLLLAVQTGLRLSELTGLRPQDLHLGTGAHVRCVGKGRRERSAPLTQHVRSALTTNDNQCQQPRQTASPAPVGIVRDAA